MIFHLGYPKCASTTLQLEFVNSDCIYLGCNPKNKIGDFYCENIGNFLDSIFRFGSDYQFNNNYTEVAEYIHKLNEVYHDKLVLSLESSIKRIVPLDLPTDIKVRRLSKLLPKETTFVILHRPIKKHLFSQYRDFLGCGYAYSFEDYISEMSLVWDYGFVSDLCLESIIKLIIQVFPHSKILVADIENSNFLPKVFDFLNLKNSLSTNKINEGITSNVYLNHLNFNKSQLNKRSFLDMIEVHRVFPNGNVDDSLKFKYARMRNNHKKLNFIKEKYVEFSIVDFKWPDYINRIDDKNNFFLSNKEKYTSLTLL